MKLSRLLCLQCRPTGGAHTMRAAGLPRGTWWQQELNENPESQILQLLRYVNPARASKHHVSEVVKVHMNMNFEL